MSSVETTNPPMPGCAYWNGAAMESTDYKDLGYPPYD
jgi:hypothetical protein